MPRDRNKFHRIDLHLEHDDPLLIELQAEAQQRRVKHLARHIIDVLRARSLARQGQRDPLWVPAETPVAAPPAPPPPDEPAVSPQAKAAAKAWGRKK